MTTGYHELFVRGWGRWHSNRFNSYVVYTPLKVAEFRSLSTNEQLQAMPDDKLDRLWVKPVQRMLQQRFRIEQRAYSAGSVPTLAELDEDFKVAATITIDKFASNTDERTGTESVAGVGTASWDNEIPPRAKALLERYRWRGGKVGRA